MPDSPAARIYRVEPESEPLTAVEYLRAQADFTQGWIDTDAARAMNPADVAVSKDLADASLEVLAELERSERRLLQTNDDRAQWRERALSAEQALGLYGAKL